MSETNSNDLSGSFDQLHDHVGSNTSTLESAQALLTGLRDLLVQAVEGIEASHPVQRFVQALESRIHDLAAAVAANVPENAPPPVVSPPPAGQESIQQPAQREQPDEGNQPGTGDNGSSAQTGNPSLSQDQPAEGEDQGQTDEARRG